MSIFNQSSSPLSSLMPQSSPYQMPDYANAFRMNMQPQMNNLKFKIGLATSNSSDPLTALNGKNMMNDAMNPDSQDNQLLQRNNSGGVSFDWDQGFNTLSQIGNSIGGQAGNVLNGAGKIGSSIKMINQANKGIKAGLGGAKSAKMGGIGATIGAASDLVGSFMPQKTEYAGPKGDITQTMDSIYDGISDAAMAFGPIGCVCAGSRVINNEGKFLNIEDLVQEEGIIGWGNRKANRENIFALKTPDYKECLRIELESGTILECSIDHPILYSPKGRAERVTINGERKRVKQWKFKSAETLQVGDNVGIINEIPIWGEEEMWNPYLVGMLIGDGTYGEDHGVRLYSGDPDTWSYIEKYQLGGKINFDDSQYTSEFRGYRIFNGAKQLRILGIYEQTKCNKRLPINIHKYTKESICKLIAGLIDTDGCVQSNPARKEFKVIFYQKNETLIKQLREQLLKLGIHSSIQSIKERKSTIMGRKVNSSNGYKLVIKDKLSLVNFYNNISLNIQYKQKALEEIYSYCQIGSTKDNRLLSGAKADKVVSITPIGSRLVYNLQADDDHTYIANGIITHNTLVGGIMKGGALLGKGVNALGGGTDGMCVCAGTKIFKASGEIINIEDLKKEDGIIGWDKNSKQIVPQLIHDFIEPRQKECLEIVLKNGYSIKCSIDHPILSDNSPKARNKVINGKRIAIRPWEFRRADELKVGDFVGLANNIDYWGDTNVPNAYIVGLLIGDGSYGKGASCRLISADPDTWRFLENNNLGVLNHCDDSRPEKYNKEIRTYRIIGGMELLHQLGIAYQTGKNKTLPKNIGKFDKVSVCNLLAGLFDTDGSISVNEEKQSYSITLYQSNINLLEEVRIQLHKLGIFSTIGTRKAAKYKFGGKIINSNESYRLEIHDISSVIKFYNLIPLNISYKKENLQRIYNMLKDKKVQEHNDISGAKQCKIVSITPIGIQTVYNLQADYNHTYLANCIITHNTTTDAILGSSFLNLTPIGLVNGFGGKKTDTITKDNEVFAQVGSSYTGSESTVNNALQKSGKKYGLLSSRARKRANEEIAEAKRQQNIISDIAEESTDRFNIRNSMAAINGNRRGFNMYGGYNQSAIRVGRHGMSIELLEKARTIIKAQQGTKTLDPFQVYLQSLPDNQRDSTNYRVKDYWIFNGRPSNFEEAKRKGMFVEQEDFDDTGKSLGKSWHSFTVAENPNTGELEFMKSSSHPTIQKELDWYNSDDGKYFRSQYELVKTEPYYKYVKRKIPIKQETPQHKNGGSIIELISETTISLVDPLNVPEFQNGGSINVIPDGALHARKHNMNLDGITEKGIPVVSEKDDGKIEQQAEIEKEEVIFRLEVTQKLEELEKKYYSEEASQKEKDEYALEAGKLITEELLHNTKDNAGLL